MKPKFDIVDQLRQAILDSGETRYAIAQATGVDQGTLSRFVRSERKKGSRTITIETAALVCDHLGLHLAPIRR